MEIIRPNPGPQTKFLKSQADIKIFGGCAGPGKTWALLLDPFRFCVHPSVRNYAAVVFRRTFAQVEKAGGIWEKSRGLFSGTGATSYRGRTFRWVWPGNNMIEFGHLQRADSVEDWQGQELAYIAFDELTHFEESQFWYLVSRARSQSGVHTKIAGTCNPDPDSWVLPLIQWWIDDDGFFIPERSGVLRWFVRDDEGKICWFDSKKEAVAFADLHYGALEEKKRPRPMSLTFIGASLDDNPKGDPNYATKLWSLHRVEKERLLHGNWKVRPQSGDYFNRRDFPIVEAASLGRLVGLVRHWDLAASTPSPEYPDPDWTSGALVGRYADGRWIILDIDHFRLRVSERDERMRKQAVADKEKWGSVKVSVPRGAADAGVMQLQALVKLFAGFSIFHVDGKIGMPETGEKETRIATFASQCQAGNVDVLRGPWNDAFFVEGEKFPFGSHDDDLDAATNAWRCLAKHSGIALLSSK